MNKETYFFSAGVVGIIVSVVAIAAGSVGGSAIKGVSMFTGLFSGSVGAIYFAAAFFPFTTSLVIGINLWGFSFISHFFLSQSLIIGLAVSIGCSLVAVVGQIRTKPYEYPWLPMNTDNCSNVTEYYSTSMISPFADNFTNFTETFTTTASNVEQVPENWFYSLAFNYFALFSLLTCLLTSFLVSLISFLVSKVSDENRKISWLHPPKSINPALMAIPSSWIPANSNSKAG